MVGGPPIQTVMFAMPVSLQVVLLMFRSMRMHLDQRRRPGSPTPPLSPVLQLVPLVPQAPPAPLSLPVLLLELQPLPLGQ